MATLLGDPGEKAGADLVSALFLWALSLRKQNSNLSRQTPYTLSREDELSRTDFDAFASRIEQPRTLSAGVHALDYTTIAAFLSLNFDVSIETPAPEALIAPAEQQKGIPIPLPPDLVLQTDAGQVLWSADSSAALDAKRETDLRDYFDQLATFARDTEPVSRKRGVAEKRAAEMIFEDWVALLLKSAILTARKCFDLDPTADKLSVDTLLKKVHDNSRQTLNMASRFILHGLRVPTFNAMGNIRLSTTIPLYDMLGQQIDPGIAPPSADHLDLVLASKPRTPDAWLRVVSQLDRARIGMVEVRKLQQLEFQAPALLSARQGEAVRVLPKIYPLTVNRVTTIRGASNWQLRLFPEELAGDLAGPLVVGKLAVVKTDSLGRRSSTPIPPEESWAWATTIIVSIRSVRRGDGSTIQGLYEFVGADDRNRERLDILLENDNYAAWRDGIKLHLLRPEANDHVTIDPLTAGLCLLLKTNLSVENHPPKDRLLRLTDENLFSADLNTQPVDFLRLVRQCSIVNSGGFWLSYGDSEAKKWFDGLLSAGQPVKVILAVEYSSRNLQVQDASATLPRFLDSLLIKSAALAACELEFERTDPAGVLAQPAVQPGCVVIEVERKNPNFPSKAVLTGDEAIQREIQVRYNLLDYGFEGSHAGFSDIPADGLLPAGPENHPTDRNESFERLSDPDGEPESWKYRIIVPLYRWAQANIGNKVPSPYAGIGATGLTLTIGARDIFGNRLATALPRARLALGADANGVRITHLYTDSIPAPSEWPGVTFVYQPAKAGSNGMDVHARFDSAVFVHLDRKIAQAARQRRTKSRDENKGKDDIRIFYRRLGQILACKDISAPIFARVKSDAGEVIEGIMVNAIIPLRKFVAAIWTTLDGGTVQSSVLVPLLATVDISGLVKKMPAAAPLEIVLVIARDPSIVHAAVKSDPTIGAVSLSVSMDFTKAVPSARAHARDRMRAKSSPSPWVDFATRFEAAVPGLRFLRGLDEAGVGRAWIAKNDLLDLSAAFGPNPKQYVQAIAPLSTQLVSGEVNYPLLENGQSKSERVVDADLDALASSAIDILEMALEPLCASQIRSGDASAFSALLSAKRQIASAFAARVIGTRPMDQSAAQVYRDQAGKLVYDRLCADLRGAYDIGGIIQIIGNGYSEAGLKRRFLYGEPSFFDNNPSNQGKLTFGVAKFERRKVMTGEVPPAFSIVASWPHGVEAEKPWDVAGDLEFKPAFIEIPSGSAKQPDDAYVPSQWLQILTSVVPARWTISGNLPLRRFPENPKVDSHSSFAELPPPSPPKTIAEHVTSARSWTYRFAWSHNAAKQDSFDLVVVYPRSQAAAFSRSTQDVLLQELVALDRNREKITDALAKMSTTPDPQSTPSEAEKKAAVFLSARITAIAAALASYVKDSVPAACTGQTTIPIEPPSNQDYDALTLRQGNAPALDLRKTPQTAQVRARFMATIGTMAPKAPAILRNEPGRRLGNTGVVTNHTMPRGRFSLDVQHLDALQEPAAWSAVRVVRNQGLCEAFVYRTPWARVVEALPARNVYDYWFSLVGTNGPRVALQSCLASFIQALFDRPDDVGAYSLQAFASLAVPLAPSGLTPSREADGGWATHPLPSISARPVTTPDLPNFARDLATMISDWNRESPISQDPTVGGAELRFAFTVFGRITKDTSGGSATVQVPVLDITHAFAPILRLSF